MRVMYVASEATPFIKSGGLADVIGSLPKETAKKDVESIVVIPKYQDMKFVDQIEYVTNFDIYMGWRKRYCGIFKAELMVSLSTSLIMNNILVDLVYMDTMMIMKDLLSLILQS